MSAYARLGDRLATIEAEGRRRQLHPLTMTSSTEGLLDGRAVTVFCSNDYLGLAHHPEVVAAWRGAGAGSARLISGDRPAHHALEDALSAHFGRPATLFSSGYHANLALLSTVLSPGDHVVSDALNHASIIDGIRLARATKTIAAHGDAARHPGTLAVVEGLYSMDGDRPPLGPHAADWLAVDEAHAVGVIGAGGRGSAAAAGVIPDFLVGTLGKAYGAFGAFVVGPPELRALFLSSGRTFIFTTGLPEPAAAAALAGLHAATDARRQRLADRVSRFRRGAAELGLDVRGTDHICPVVFGSTTMSTAAALLDAGFYVPGIRPPTVPAGTERLRLTLSADHDDDQIDGLLEALHDAPQAASIR